MKVYVLNQNGQPMMPTERCGKVRRLLKAKKARVVKRCPFTIQLLYETETHVTQPLTLGVDAGSKHIGLCASSEDRVMYEADVELKNDIVGLLSARREQRRSRRNRKTRYRAPRFDNRRRREGWLAPSVQHKADTHLAVIAKVWDCLLTEEDAAYVQPHQNYGIWSKIINPTIEECKSLLRAKQLKNIALQILQEENNGETKE
jgi:hypothetical protein